MWCRKPRTLRPDFACSRGSDGSGAQFKVKGKDYKLAKGTDLAMCDAVVHEMHQVPLAHNRAGNAARASQQEYQ
jgi:hypothetical protein